MRSSSTNPPGLTGHLVRAACRWSVASIQAPCVRHALEIIRRKIRCVTSSSSPCRGMTWRSRDKTCRKRSSVCRRRISRTRLHSRHNIWRNTPPQWRRDRFAVRTTSRTFCSIPRSPRRGACTWHVPFSHRPRAMRSDGSMNRKSLGNQRRRLRTSTSWRHVDCRPRTRTRSRRREPKPPHSVRPFGNS